MSGLHSRQDGIFGLSDSETAKELRALRHEVAQLRGLVEALYEQRLTTPSDALSAISQPNSGRDKTPTPDADMDAYLELGKRLSTFLESGAASPEVVLRIINTSPLWTTQKGEPMKPMTKSTLLRCSRGRLNDKGNGIIRPFLSRAKVDIVNRILNQLEGRDA
jgi:hypothetical protein